MKSIRNHKWLCVFTASLMAVMCLIGSLPQGSMITAKAISVDYPAQLMRISTADNARNLNITGTKDKSACNTWTTNGEQNENWRFDRVGADSNGTYFKIVNMGSGRLLTPMGYNVAEGTEAVIFGSESAKSQHWYVIPVSTDRLGNNLHYKIVNYENTNLALTYNASANTITLSTYSGADSQKWLLNPTGLQGFAGYCKDDNTGSVKAADIGGLFGETVEVSTFDDLKKYATSDTPYTIVVNKNISVTELNMNGTRYMCTAGRIYVHSNKTIIGSYGAHTLFNVQFCTSSNSGTGNNIIIKNFDMQHDAESNNNDSIVCYFGSGENIWVDHVTFTGHNNYGYAPQTGQVDEDKFLACCYDADYCTVSDCSFGAHKYGLILGYPSDGETEYNNYNGYPRMSIISNKFNDTNTRGPGLMRWGYFHSLNNYVNKFSMAYTVISDCDIYAENCVYENGGNVICDWDKMTYSGYYTETGSIFSGCNRTQQGGDSNSTAGASSWRPSKNYDYKSITAENAKTYCNTYTGVQNSGSNYNYLTSASAGCPSAGYVELPTEDMDGKTGAVLDTAYTYRFRNYGSGYTLEVADGVAANGTNVQQGNTGADLWTLADAGDGYYKIYSEVGDGKTFLLDLDYGNVENGTNIGIWSDTAADAQLFKFVDNGDGTYAIVTKPTKDESGIGIASGSTESGANAIQWAYDGSDNQKWIIERVIGSTPLIQELGVQDSTTYASWKLDESAAVGDLVFGDRDVTYVNLPDYLVGAEMIQTACDGKNWAGTQAVFTAGADIEVFVALDQRVTTAPAWLEGWTPGSETITNSKDVVFNLYSCPVSAGETVYLGTNGQSASCVNYTIFAIGQESEPAVTLYAGDVTLDGIVDGFDLAMMKRSLLTGHFTSTSAAECADVNADGSVNVTDAVRLTQYLLGKDVTLSLSGGVVNTPSVNAYEPAGFSFSGNVYLVGDSTVCEYDSDTVSSLNRMGWGMKLAEEYNNVNVKNLALSGRSSRSFLTEANYQTLCSSIGKGDYLFIQFGHNDEKTDDADRGTYPDLDMSSLDSSGMNSSGQYSYEWIILNKYIKVAQEKGAVPVIITPITRRASSGGANYSQHTPYQQALIALGAQEGVAVIDMTTLTTDLYTELYNSGGADVTASLHCLKTDGSIDNTHLSSYGAELIAGIIADSTKALGLTIGDRLK